MTTEVKVHPLTESPTEAWKEISKTQKIFQLNMELPSTPVDSNKVRFVCMSDTHSLIRNIKFDIPEGDVFIHAGDFTNRGERNEVIQFDKWLGTLPHKYKIVISGNHELSFDEKFEDLFRKKTGNQDSNSFKEETAVDTDNIRKYLTNCIYLEDSSVEIYGIKLFGSPWQPYFGNLAFNLRRGQECLSKWEKIPEDTDILVTHSPPLGHGDLVRSGARVGCVELLSTVQNRVKPKYHIFGHIHEGYGVTSDGSIIFINASTCDVKYVPNNLPVVFDVPLPKGQVKC